MEDWINDGEESLMIRKRVKNMNDDDGEGSEKKRSQGIVNRSAIWMQEKIKLLNIKKKINRKLEIPKKHHL